MSYRCFCRVAFRFSASRSNTSSTPYPLTRRCIAVKPRTLPLRQVSSRSKRRTIWLHESSFHHLAFCLVELRLHLGVYSKINSLFPEFCRARLRPPNHLLRNLAITIMGRSTAKYQPAVNSSFQTSFSGMGVSRVCVYTINRFHLA